MCSPVLVLVLIRRAGGGGATLVFGGLCYIEPVSIRVSALWLVKLVALAGLSVVCIAACSAQGNVPVSTIASKPTQVPRVNIAQQFLAGPTPALGGTEPR